MTDPARQNCGSQQPERQPRDAADETEHARLDQELAQDHRRGRPEGLAQPDFPRALRNGHQHDVHDPDPADQQRDAGDHPQEDGQQAGDRAEALQQTRLGHHQEIIFIAEVDLVFLAQCLRDLRLSLIHISEPKRPY